MTRRERSASKGLADSEWILVAARQDEDVVELLLKQAPSNGIRIGRVLWADHGPIKIYRGVEELWRDAFSCQQELLASK